MKLPVILNASAGPVAGRENSDSIDRVRAAFDRAGIDTDITAQRPEHFMDAVRAAAALGSSPVVIGGGDGTLNAGATVLLSQSRTLGILPLGTLNHFARDLGIPMDLDQAVETIKAGNVREVDVGEVNDRVFLNNSSIGLYPIAVAEREELRHRSGGGKWASMFLASAQVFRRFPLLEAALTLEGQTISVVTPFVFVGNNRYEMRLLTLGTRSSLEEGELSVYLPKRGGRLGVLLLALRGVFGRLDQARDFHSTVTPALEIRTRRRSLRVSLDGEVAHMTSPIRFTTRPRALRVLAPPAVDKAVKA